MTASRAARAADEEARAASVLFAIEELWLLQACIRHEVQQAEQWQSPLASLKLTTRSPTLSSSASRTGLPRRPSSSTARTARKGAQRRALEAAIGPVWETNHVWLILLVVVAFTAFPSAFAALFTALYVPLFLALVGIVARGGAFAFHHYGDRTSPLAQASYHFFSIASTLTPFTFGMTVGAAASGDIELADGRVVSGPFAAWLGPFYDRLRPHRTVALCLLGR